MLQRGRARAGAELSQSERLTRRLALLQRGRARAGAEFDLTVKTLGSRLRLASTGPRPRGRGIIAFAMMAARANALQRGRARAGAEFTGCGRSRSTPLTAQLQRGRARAGAEFDAGSASGSDVAGFNGAAPARARN